MAEILRILAQDPSREYTRWQMARLIAEGRGEDNVFSFARYYRMVNSYVRELERQGIVVRSGSSDKRGVLFRINEKAIVVDGRRVITAPIYTGGKRPLITVAIDFGGNPPKIEIIELEEDEFYSILREELLKKLEENANSKKRRGRCRQILT